MQTKKIIFFITALLYIIYLIFPLFANYFGFPTWLFPIVVSAIILVLFPRLIAKNKTIYWFLIYCLITYIFMSFGRVLKLDIGTSKYMNQLLIEYAFFLPSIMIGIVLLNLKDVKLYKKLSFYTLLFLFVSFIIIIPQLNNIDLRNLTLSEEAAMGIMGYTLMHTYVIILPAVICGCFVSTRIRRLLFFVLLLLVLFVIIKTSITTTILISLGILAFSFGYRNNRALLVTSILVLVVVVTLYYGGGGFLF